MKQQPTPEDGFSFGFTHPVFKDGGLTSNDAAAERDSGFVPLQQLALRHRIG